MNNQVIINEDRFVVSACIGGIIEGGIEILPEVMAAANFDEIRGYRLSEDCSSLVFDAARWAILCAGERSDEIRILREVECFSVINRGELWYNKLTEIELAELELWYRAWLDAPQTGAIPDKPEFII